MERQTVYITEKKEKIEKIKQKYENMSMSDNTAQKIQNLEVTNNILKTATTLVGIATVVNWIVPDNLPLVDEVILTGLTALLNNASKIVENNIDSLAKSGTSDIKMNEIKNLAGQLNQIITDLKSKKIK